MSKSPGAHLANSQISTDLVDGIENLNGTFPGYRRAHARGLCYQATFTPSGEASGLTRAAHLQHTPVAATVRFSHTSTNPNKPDGEHAVRGFATKFHLANSENTDLIMVNVERFIAATPAAFGDLLAAAKPNAATGVPDLTKVQEYVGAHPTVGPALKTALAVAIPTSYGTSNYWAIHAFTWLDAAGERRSIRYRWVPVAGVEEVSTAEAAGWSQLHLAEELAERLGSGPLEFNLLVQLAEPGDPTSDCTQAWPGERKEINVGTLVVTAPVDDQDFWASQVFDPTLLTDGVEVSDDPILVARSTIYAVSYDRRSRKQ
jgi:catalase